MKSKSYRFYPSLMLLTFVFGWFFFTTPALGAPGTSEYVYARGLNSSEITVNWQPVEGAAGYYVYRSETEQGTYKRIGQTIGGHETYFLDKDADYDETGVQPLGASKEYYYKVSAYDDTGESSMSPVTTHKYTNSEGQEVTEKLSMGRTTTAVPPGGLTLTDNNDGTVKITWNRAKEPNISGYNLYRSENSGGGFSKINTEPITEPEYIDGINFYRHYYYVIAAIDSTGTEGRKSPEKWIKPEARAPSEVPHVQFAPEARECAFCHSTHTSPGRDLLKKQAESEVCFVCHDGTGSQNVTYQDFNGIATSKHPLGEKGLSCASCHDSHLDYRSMDSDGEQNYPKLLRGFEVEGNMVNKGNNQCYKCHGQGSGLKGGDHQTAFEKSVHATAMADPASGTQIACISCHDPHASSNSNLKVYKAENACFACHSEGQGSSTVNIFDSVFAGEGKGAHVLTEAQQKESGSKLACVNCHNPHGVTKENKLTDPYNPAPNSSWQGSTIDFCLKCHDGNLPQENQTMPFAPGVSKGNKNLVNIKEAYFNSSDGKTDKHGEGDGQPKHLDLAMGYSNALDAPNYVFHCNVCHEPHGSANVYNLRSELTSIDGTKTKSGLMTYDWTYSEEDKPLRGSDTRFFCNSCHGGNNMGNKKSFPTNCLACHGHKKEF